MKNIVAVYTQTEKKLTIINKNSSIVSDIIKIDGVNHSINFIQREGHIFTSLDGATTHIEPGKIISGNGFELLLQSQVEKKFYSTEGIKLITISKENYSTITLKSLSSRINISFVLENNSIQLHPSNEQVTYVNNINVNNIVNIEYGDVVDINGCEIIFRKHTVEITDNLSDITQIKLLNCEEETGLRKVSSDYKRSPRIIHNSPDEDITLSNPPAESKQEAGGLIKLIIPPLITMSVTIAMGILMKRGPYIYMMMATSLVTVGLSVVNYFKQKKDRKLKNENRVVVYREYLKRKIKAIALAVNEQSFALNYHYPTSNEILNMVTNHSARMYEKSTLHHDFLQVRIGRSNVDLSFKVAFDEKDFSEVEDFLIDEARDIKNRFTTKNELPRTIHLQHGAVGLIGNRHILVEQVALIINQLAFFHSYHDLEIIHVFPEEEINFWKNFDFLPHINSKNLHARTNIYSEKTRDQILSSVYQILKQRSQSLNEKVESNSGTSLGFSPNIVLIISDMKQIIDHSIMEFLSKDITNLGVNVIYVDRSMKNLPEHVVTVVEYKNEKEARIVNEENIFKQEQLFLDHVGEFDFSIIPRIISGYNHVLTLQSAIPEKVGFLEMFEVEYTSELNIESRWNSGEPGKTLAVPLGYRAPSDIVMLNLHEKAHGPHGLVAGTTGSGKSEIVQSYILSLAINFHPYDVGFLLIDYKGGGMANLFKDLPHLLGTITNLDGAASMRALISIKAELLRRQQLFSENDVNHIDGYQRLFKEGKVKEPMPHLFMISDEFAELKSEQPEFMKELVSTARIGRSLGIHLILATQKPSGVVDDQIWSNSKFKLCLKVQNEADSNEMLKTKDAAAITQPGRSYLQVGNNEIYELFQSAYSGAPYMGGIETEDVKDNRIYEINSLGQYELRTQDLSKGNINTHKDELTAVVEEVAATFNNLNIEKVPSPWLEPLSDHIYLNELQVETSNLEVILGLSDEPNKQAQNPLVLDLNSGHVGIFGLSGFGKTTLLQSMIMNLSKNNTPEQLHMYLIDFGGGLLPFRDLPHVADIVTLDEEEKLAKLLRLINVVTKERKKLFKKAGVADITTYQEMTKINLPKYVITIDNFDASKDLQSFEQLDAFLNQISREGINLGIHIVISANALNSVKYTIQSNIKNKLTFFVLEKSDIMSTVGRTQLEVEEIPGRAIIKIDEPLIFQACLPIEGDNNKLRITALREYSNSAKNQWDGNVPSNIPMIPEELTLEVFNQIDSVKVVKEIPNKMSVGLDIETVQSLNFENKLLIVGTSNVIYPVYEAIYNTIASGVEVITLDTKTPILSNYQKNSTSYTNEPDDYLATISTSMKEMISRVVGESKSDKEIVIIISDTPEFLSYLSDEGLEQFKNIYSKLSTINSTIILGFNPSQYCKVDNIVKSTIEETTVKVIGGKVGDIPSLAVNGVTFREPDIAIGEANYLYDRDYKKFKLIDKN